MKVIGIQINSNEAVFVVLQLKSDGEIVQTNESAKYVIKDHTNSTQVRQFKDQITAAFDTIKPDKVGVIARIASGRALRASSPISFKLEGIIQLYEKIKVEFIWPQTISPFIRKNAPDFAPKNKYQEDALNLAFFLIKKS